MELRAHLTATHYGFIKSWIYHQKYGFIKSFNAMIRERVTEPASQLEYLIDMCTGKAREAIKHLSIVTPPSLGMKSYGNVAQQIWSEAYCC